MSALFYISGLIAVISAIMVVTRANAMHALIYLVLLFLSIASVFMTLGAPFIAAFQIVVYAGAIMVLFVFAVMMLNLGQAAEVRERSRMLGIRVWWLPAVLGSALFALSVAALVGPDHGTAVVWISPKAVGISLFGHYLIGVELASLMLLAGLVAGFHFGSVERSLPPNEGE